MDGRLPPLGSQAPSELVALWLDDGGGSGLRFGPHGGSNFLGCFDHGNGGAAPAGAPTLYAIKRNANGPRLVPTAASEIGDKPVFKLIIEDVRFTSYKWSTRRDISRSKPDPSRKGERR